MSGKGSTPRPCDGDKFRRNYDRIFGRDGYRKVRIDGTDQWDNPVSEVVLMPESELSPPCLYCGKATTPGSWPLCEACVLDEMLEGCDDLFLDDDDNETTP